MTDLDLYREQGFRVPVPLGCRIVRCELRTAAAIRAESSGEVTVPASYHARTDEPIPGGLFAPEIFGPVERTPDRVAAETRRKSWGHIELPFPVPHPFGGGFLEVVPVLPPWFRPIIVTGSTGWMTSDLNVLYRKVIELVGWFRKLQLAQAFDLSAPERCARQEQLKGRVADLFDNESRPDPQRASDRPLASLAGMIRGVRATGAVGAGEQLSALFRAAALDVTVEHQPLPRFGTPLPWEGGDQSRRSQKPSM